MKKLILLLLLVIPLNVKAYDMSLDYSRLMADCVAISDYKMGEIYQAIYDELLGYTYLCYLSNSSLYEGISK